MSTGLPIGSPAKSQLPLWSTALLATIVALGISLPLSAPALAQPMDTYGMGSRSIALAGAVTSDVEDFSANYYNPAGIVRSGELRVGVGWFGAAHDMNLNGLRSNVDPVHGIVVGLNVPGELNGVRFGFGLGLHLNDQRVARTRTLPVARPRWELYDNRPHRTYLATHLAIQPWSWLRIGGGISFLSLSSNNLRIRGDLDATSPERGSDLEHDLVGELLTIRYPQVGIQVQPLDNLDFGIVYRGSFGVATALTANVGTDDPNDPNAARINVGDISVNTLFELLTDSIGAYVPQQVSLGASYSPIPMLRFYAEVTWLNWSAYVSPIGTSLVNLEIDVPPELQDTISVPDEIMDTFPIAAEFQDRFVPRIGVEVLAIENTDLQLALRAGYFYENTPVPDQSGLTNLVDTDRHAFQGGIGLRLNELGDWLPGHLNLDAHFQYSWLPERSTIKRSPIDPVGDYVASGQIFAGGATLELAFR